MIDYVHVAIFFFFKQKTAYEMRISDWSSDVCSSDLALGAMALAAPVAARQESPIIEPANGEPIGPDEPTSGEIEQIAQESAGEYFARSGHNIEIGRASCRDRVCQYV